MRSRTMFLALTISTVIAAGLFLPNFTYAEQIGSTHAILGSVAGNVDSSAPVLTVRGHGGGGWHGAARAFHGGRGFYGPGFSYGYSSPYYYGQYYTAPSCDSMVWDSDLDEWVCSDDYTVY